MPYLQSNGVRFHVQTLAGEGEGPRPKVVMLHGLVIDNLSSWFYILAAPIAAAGYDVHLVDLRGHGRTEMPDEDYSVDTCVDDMLGLLEAWEIDEPVHFFGNSFGCVVSLALAHRHPERVASLFLIEAHFSVPGWGEKMAGSLQLAAWGLDEDEVRHYLETEADRKTSRLAKRTEKLFFGTSLIADLKAEPPIDWLDRISCPVQAIYGSESDILDRARELETKVPDCRLEIVPDSSHSLLIERSALIRERALAWLGEQTGTPVATDDTVVAGA